MKNKSVRKISPEEKRIIDAVHAVKLEPVQRIMIPRDRIKMFSYATPIRKVIDTFRKSFHSRYPVYYPNSDQIVGILHVKDIMTFWHEHPDTPAIEFVRFPYFVYENRPALDVFLELQRFRVSIAVVIDEFGGLAGLITIEDLVEEIVGDMSDEHDRATETMMEMMSAREGVVDARMPLKDFCRQIGISIIETDVSTVAGLILKHADRIPKPGEEITIGDLKFTVLTASRRKINKVSVMKGITHNPPFKKGGKGGF